MAFGIEGYVDRVGKDDPYFVEWVVQLKESVNGVETHYPLKVHKCNDTDWDANFF